MRISSRLAMVVATTLAVAAGAGSRMLHAARPAAGSRAALVAGIRPFPSSQLDGAYEMSVNDDYHFALPYASAAVRYAAYSVYRRFGRATEPMTICDCSTAAGLTPAGRHPGGAHDNGINFDITYFMKRPVDMFIVCPQHSDNHCVGPAVDLDVDRQAYFFAKLGQLDRETDDGLLVCMAVDGWVKQALMPAFARLEMTGEFSRPVIEHTKELVYGEMTDQGTGWFRFHLNHTHLRFHPLMDDSLHLASFIESRIGRVINGSSTATPARVATLPPAPKPPAAPAPVVVPPPAPKPAATAKPAPAMAARPASTKPVPVIEAPTESFVLVLPHKHAPSPRPVPSAH